MLEHLQRLAHALEDRQRHFQILALVRFALWNGEVANYLAAGGKIKLAGTMMRQPVLERTPKFVPGTAQLIGYGQMTFVSKTFC